MLHMGKGNTKLPVGTLSNNTDKAAVLPIVLCLPGPPPKVYLLSTPGPTTTTGCAAFFSASKKGWPGASWLMAAPSLPRCV